MTANIISAAFRKHPAWHGLGVTKPEGWDTIGEAMAEAGVLYTMEKRPLTVNINGTDTMFGKQYAVVRSPMPNDPDSEEVFFKQTVGRHFTILQPEELGRILEPLAQIGDYTIDTVGALGDGERLFITLGMGDLDIKGEQFKQWLFISDGYDGRTNFRMDYVPVRVVCQNTWALAHTRATALNVFRHDSDIQEGVDFAVEVEKNIISQRDQLIADSEQFMAMAWDSDRLNRGLEVLYPDHPLTPAQRRVRGASERGVELKTHAQAGKAATDDQAWGERMEGVRAKRVEAARAYAQFNDEHPQYANTAWAWLNSATEANDWMEGKRAGEGFAASHIWGGRAATRKRVFEFALREGGQ